jgi:hypothetical protein
MDTTHLTLEMMQESGNVLHSFFIAPHQCFRLLKSDSPQAAHCPEPVVWKGPWRDVMGELWTVEACELHRPQSNFDQPVSRADQAAR